MSRLTVLASQNYEPEIIGGAKFWLAEKILLQEFTMRSKGSQSPSWRVGVFSPFDTLRLWSFEWVRCQKEAAIWRLKWGSFRALNAAWLASVAGLASEGAMVKDNVERGTSLPFTMLSQ